MVKAKDGDLEVVAKLSQALSDLDSMKSMSKFLRQHPEGEKAFQEYPRLGNVKFDQLHQLAVKKQIPITKLSIHLCLSCTIPLKNYESTNTRIWLVDKNFDN